jgi:hypothetical protein
MQWINVSQYLDDLSRVMGGGVDGSRLERTLEDCRWQVEAREGKGNVTLTLRVWPPSPLSPAAGGAIAPILLRPELGLDRFGKALRIARECQLGDPEFDRRVYVDTEAADVTVTEVLAAPAARRAVIAALDDGFARLRLFGPAAPVEATLASSTATAPDAMRVEALIGCLTALARALPDARTLRRRPERGQRRRWVPLAVAVLMPVLALAALLTHLVARQAWPLVDAAELSSLAWSWGLGLWFPALLAVILVIRNRSNAMPAAVLSALSLPFLLICGIQAMTEVLNAQGDRSAVIVREATVAHRYATSTKNGKSYHVRLAHRGPDGRDRPTFDLPVSRQDHDLLPRGARYRLYLQRGALGWEYVTRHERVAPVP